MPLVNSVFKIGLIVVCALLGALISLSVLLWFYESELGDKVILELQKNSPAEITVEDQELSLWKSLPYVSLDLKRVTVKDMNSSILLDADVLGLRLSLLNLWKNELKIENILIQNGQVNIIRDRKGRYNYQFLLDQDEVETERYFKKFNIQYAKLKNIGLSLKDFKDQWQVQYQLETGRINVASNQEKMDLDGTLKGALKNYSQQGKTRLEKVAHELDFQCTSKDQQWVFESNRFFINGDPFEVSGLYSGAKKGHFSLAVDQKEGRMGSIFRLLQSPLDLNPDWTAGGSYKAQMRYEKRGNMEDFELTGKVWDGSLKAAQRKSIFNTLSGNFFLSKPKNIPWQDMVMTFSDINSSDKDFHLKSDIRITGLQSPRYTIKTAGSVALNSLNELIQGDAVQCQKGVASTNKLDLDIAQREDRWIVYDASGEILLEHAVVDYRKKRIEVPRSSWVLSPSLLYMDTAPVKLDQSVFECKLSFPNFKDNLSRKKLQLVSEINGAELEYDLLKDLLVEEEGKDKKKETEVSEGSEWDIQAEVDASVGKFFYQKNEFSEVDAHFDLNKDELLFDLNSKAYEGSLKARGKYYFSKRPRLSLNLETEKVLIKELLKNFDNFDQEVILDKNIEGKMDSKNVIRLFWDEKGTYLENDLEVYSDIQITNGALKGVTMLYDFSSFIKLRDLMEIKFSTLHNYLEVSDQKVYIPQMFIQSSAMNMTVAGKHGFDSQIHYGFKFNAGQILLNKLKKHNSKRRILPAKKEGMFNMYFNMEGTVQDYQVKSSKKMVQSYFEESETHKYIIYEELKRAYPNIVNPEYEPEEWLDIDEQPSIFENKRSSGGLSVDVEEDVFIDGF